MHFNAPILVIVPPRTAAGSRSDPRLGLAVIYGVFGEAALLMQRTRQQVWCWLIGHDAPQPTLSGADDKSPARRHTPAGRGVYAIRALPDLCLGIVSGRLEAHSL